MAHYFGNFCELCINNYYINRTDHVCYDITQIKIILFINVKQLIFMQCFLLNVKKDIF